jgi:hypothetical protein
MLVLGGKGSDSDKHSSLFLKSFIGVALKLECGRFYGQLKSSRRHQLNYFREAAWKTQQLERMSTNDLLAPMSSVLIVTLKNTFMTLEQISLP